MMLEVGGDGPRKLANLAKFAELKVPFIRFNLSLYDLWTKFISKCLDINFWII